MIPNRTFVLFTMIACLILGVAMMMPLPPPPSSPVLPATPYKYAPENTPDYINPWSDLMTVSDHMATLGRVLFYDVRLSKNEELSCGSCHLQERSFADDVRFSEGINESMTVRNTPNLNDLGWRILSDMFWDFRESEMHELVLQPILNEEELDGNIDLLIERLSATNFYDELFENAFNEPGINKAKISEAMAAFINSMNTLNSKFDQVQMGSDFFSQSELEGLDLFAEHCNSCHRSGNFGSTNMTRSFNNGLDSTYEDPGMAGWSNTNKIGIFRSPSLRNIELTAPYMHDGRLETLEDVIDFYSDEVILNDDTFFSNSTWNDPTNTFDGFHFNSIEKENLLAFLKTLTDESFIKDIKYSDPFPSSTVINAQQEILPLDGVKLFPNPVVTHLNIAYPGVKARIDLFDLHGHQLNSWQSSGGEFLMNRQDIAKGLYILRVSVGNRQSQQKVIFQ